MSLLSPDEGSDFTGGARLPENPAGNAGLLGLPASGFNFGGAARQNAVLDELNRMNGIGNANAQKIQAAGAPNPITALKMTRGKDGQSVITATGDASALQTIMGDAQKYRNMLGQTMQVMDSRAQQMEDAATRGTANPLLNFLGRFASNIAQAPNMNPMIQAMGRTAIQLNPTPMELEQSAMQTRMQSAGIAEKMIQMDELEMRRQGIEEWRRGRLKVMDEQQLNTRLATTLKALKGAAPDDEVRARVRADAVRDFGEAAGPIVDATFQQADNSQANIDRKNQILEDTEQGRREIAAQHTAAMLQVADVRAQTARAGQLTRASTASQDRLARIANMDVTTSLAAGRLEFSKQREARIAKAQADLQALQDTQASNDPLKVRDPATFAAQLQEKRDALNSARAAFDPTALRQNLLEEKAVSQRLEALRRSQDPTERRFAIDVMQTQQANGGWEKGATLAGTQGAYQKTLETYRKYGVVPQAGSEAASAPSGVQPSGVPPPQSSPAPASGSSGQVSQPGTPYYLSAPGTQGSAQAQAPPATGEDRVADLKAGLLRKGVPLPPDVLRQGIQTYIQAHQTLPGQAPWTDDEKKRALALADAGPWVQGWTPPAAPATEVGRYKEDLGTGGFGGRAYAFGTQVARSAADTVGSAISGTVSGVAHPFDVGIPAVADALVELAQLPGKAREIGKLGRDVYGTSSLPTTLMAMWRDWKAQVAPLARTNPAKFKQVTGMDPDVVDMSEAQLSAKVLGSAIGTYYSAKGFGKAGQFAAAATSKLAGLPVAARMAARVRGAGASAAGTGTTEAAVAVPATAEVPVRTTVTPAPVPQPAAPVPSPMAEATPVRGPVPSPVVGAPQPSLVSEMVKGAEPVSAPSPDVMARAKAAREARDLLPVSSSLADRIRKAADPGQAAREVVASLSIRPGMVAELEKEHGISLLRANRTEGAAQLFWSNRAGAIRNFLDQVPAAAPKSPAPAAQVPESLTGPALTRARAMVGKGEPGPETRLPEIHDPDLAPYDQMIRNREPVPQKPEDPNWQMKQQGEAWYFGGGKEALQRDTLAAFKKFGVPPENSVPVGVWDTAVKIKAGAPIAADQAREYIRWANNPGQSLVPEELLQRQRPPVAAVPAAVTSPTTTVPEAPKNQIVSEMVRGMSMEDARVAGAKFLEAWKAARIQARTSFPVSERLLPKFEEANPSGARALVESLSRDPKSLAALRAEAEGVRLHAENAEDPGVDFWTHHSERIGNLLEEVRRFNLQAQGAGTERFIREQEILERAALGKKGMPPRLTVGDISNPDQPNRSAWFRSDEVEALHRAAIAAYDRVGVPDPGIIPDKMRNVLVAIRSGGRVTKPQLDDFIRWATAYDGPTGK